MALMEPLTNLGVTMRYILERAILAPSGDNLQPWHFVVRGEDLELWNVPSRDTTIHDWDEQASYISSGAVIENIRVSASACNLETYVTYFPDKHAHNHVATIRFSSKPQLTNPLVPYIEKRASNRKPYDRTPLSKETLHLLSDPQLYQDMNTRVIITTNPEQITMLAKIAALYERFIFSSPLLHRSFFDHIVHTHEPLAAQQGLYLPTLELSFFERYALHILKYWPITRLASYLGLDAFIAFKGARTYARSAGIGAIVIENTTKETFVHAGEALERLWLTATSLNLNFQVLSGTSLVALQSGMGQDMGLRTDQKRLLAKSMVEAYSRIGVQQANILTFFRIGYGKPPSAKTERLPLEYFITIAN